MAKSYQSYRGKSRKKSGLSLLIVSLAVLVVILLIFLMLQDSMIFSSDGLRYSTPLDDASVASAEPSPKITPQLVIESPGTSASPSVPPSTSPSDYPVSSRTLKAVYLPDLSDAAAVAGAVQLADKGVINAVVVNMKRDDGTLGYQSANKNAILAGANSTSSTASEAIGTLKDAGLYLVARISAFKDNLVPRKVQSTSVKTKNGVIWLDRDYNGWLNPYLQEAQDYVLAIASEISDLGFDEIMMDNFCFPTIGRPQLLSYGDYAATPKTDALTTFAQKCDALIATKKAVLSIRVAPAAVMSGADAQTGQDPAALYSIADRIYADIGTDKTVADALYTQISTFADATSGTASGSSKDASQRFVPIINAPRKYDDPSAAENIQTAIGTFGRDNAGWLLVDTSGLYPSVGW